MRRSRFKHRSNISSMKYCRKILYFLRTNKNCWEALSLKLSTSCCANAKTISNAIIAEERIGCHFQRIFHVWSFFVHSFFCSKYKVVVLFFCYVENKTESNNMNVFEIVTLLLHETWHAFLLPISLPTLPSSHDVVLTSLTRTTVLARNILALPTHF